MLHMLCMHCRFAKGLCIYSQQMNQNASVVLPETIFNTGCFNIHIILRIMHPVLTIVNYDIYESYFTL